MLLLSFFGDVFVPVNRSAGDNNGVEKGLRNVEWALL
jgi:hypothetical protein